MIKMSEMSKTEHEIINACYAAAYAKIAALPGGLPYDTLHHEAHLAAREGARRAIDQALTNFALPAALKASHCAAMSCKQQWLKQRELEKVAAS